MACSAHLVFFFVVTMALTWSSHAWYQRSWMPSQPCPGGPHDSAVDCGTHCPLTCENPEQRPCIRSCKVKACQCKPGYLRRRDGLCATKAQCKQLAKQKDK